MTGKEKKEKKYVSIRRRLTAVLMGVAGFSMLLTSYVGIMGIIRVEIHYREGGASAKPINIPVTLLIFFGLVAAALGITYLLATRMAAKLSTPLRDLNYDMQELKRGNLDIRSAVDTEDEIGDLAKGFNDMADSLQKHLATLSVVAPESDLLHEELERARKIQMNILPFEYPPFPDRKDFELFATLKPSSDMGGDFYDYFLIDDDHLAIVIADVDSKGIAAALFMGAARNLIRELAAHSCSPSTIIENLNETFCANNPADMYISCWLGIITLSTGEGISVSTGYESPAIRNGNRPFYLQKGEVNPVLGAIPGMLYSEEEFRLCPGDCIFLYSDGITGAKDHSGNEYSVEQMLSVLNVNASQDGEKLLKQIETELRSHTGTSEPADDITMVYFRYLGADGSIPRSTISSESMDVMV